jgi:hypothetical protein
MELAIIMLLCHKIHFVMARFIPLLFSTQIYAAKFTVIWHISAISVFGTVAFLPEKTKTKSYSYSLTE